MTAAEIREKLSEPSTVEATIKILKDQNAIKSGVVEDNIKEFKGEHKILQKKNKTIVGSDNKTQTVETAKNVITFQRKIVASTVAFQYGEPVDLILKSEEAKSTGFDEIQQVWTNNKLDYFNRKECRAVSIETRAAELWFMRESADGKSKQLKVMLLKESEGDGLFPYFDEFGDMIAFTRTWKVKDENGQEETHTDIYTAEWMINYTKIGGGSLAHGEFIDNDFGKIPVIYLTQDEAEWRNVQGLIDRREESSSSQSDTNDYFGSPAVVAKGKVKNMPDKGEVGKVFQVEGEVGDEGKITYGDLEYLTWDQTPASVKHEQEDLDSLIYSMTSTADVSFDNTSGTSAVSGISMRLMFMDPLNKAKDKEEIYGEAITRRLNLIAAMLSEVGGVTVSEDLQIGIKFNSPLPEDVNGQLEALNIALGGEPSMSQKTAVRNNPYVEDPDAEVAQIKTENDASLGESAMV